MKKRRKRVLAGSVKGIFVDIEKRDIYPARVEICDKGTVSGIYPVPAEAGMKFIMPGFIDAHIHIESTMLTPSRFSALAVRHGTVAVVSDPHEIANVLGEEGIDFMLRDAAESPVRFCFGAPSCVPATQFETSGAVLGPREVAQLLERDEICYLSEVMNFPSVIAREDLTMRKIEAAKKFGKPVDGHAPGLRGEDLRSYVLAGISTDHESSSIDEAREKIAAGMKILIREGSAAKNFDALAPLISEFPDMLMFCSDDRHPDDLLNGHINTLVARAADMGYDLFDILKIACVNPAEHYGIDIGRLREGESADFILVEDLRSFRVEKTFIAGVPVFENGLYTAEIKPIDEKPNLFRSSFVGAGDFALDESCLRAEVITVFDRELFTGKEILDVSGDGSVLPDTERDILKISVVNRYDDSALPSLAFVKNFGLKKGAIASSVAHDSHNIIAVGCGDEEIAEVVNTVISRRGAIAATDGKITVDLPLPVAGLMSDEEGKSIAEKYREINDFAKNILGSTLDSPFMTLSFMALLVIPELKLSDKGLFDGREFHYVPLCISEKERR